MEYKFSNIDANRIQDIIGINDENLHLLEDLYGCGIVYRDNYFRLLSDDKDIFYKFSKHMDYLINTPKDNIIDYDFIKQSFISINEKKDESFQNSVICIGYNGKPYKCKTYKQKILCDLVNNNDLVLVSGPAGTGKTFIAVLLAINYLKKGEIEKIVITRPAVEAGESLGFLPGDLKEKIDPYLMPIYDALDLLLGKEQKDKLIEKGMIEVMPLAYMRGRTLDNAFVILDEAQNTTDKQMLMFLTRLGNNSKMIVNGDTTQIDLNIIKNNSGLVTAMNKLKDIDNIGIINFDNNDVVRNPLVQKIIEKYSI